MMVAQVGLDVHDDEEGDQCDGGGVGVECGDAQCGGGLEVNGVCSMFAHTTKNAECGGGVDGNCGVIEVGGENDDKGGVVEDDDDGWEKRRVLAKLERDKKQGTIDHFCTNYDFLGSPSTSGNGGG